MSYPRKHITTRTFDVVIDPELLDTPIEPGNVLSGWFWLSGRLRTGQPTKSGWIKKLLPNW